MEEKFENIRSSSSSRVYQNLILICILHPHIESERGHFEKGHHKVTQKIK
jgi:hypothetical protein